MSVPFLYLAGAGYNQLARCATAPTPGSSDSILGNVGALYDYETWEPFVFDGTNYLDIDLNQVPNGDFEAAFVSSLPTAAWVKLGSCTISRDTVTFDQGAASLKITGVTAQGAGAYYDLVVAAGEVLNFDPAIRIQQDSVGSDAAVRVSVRNLVTGNYLAADGTWQASLAGWVSDTTLASPRWVSNTDGAPGPGGPGYFTVESYATCKSDLVTLRVYCWQTNTLGSGSNTLWFDNVVVYPRINYVSIHGHNTSAGMGPVELRSGTSSPAATVRATLTLAQPTMFASFAAKDARYWRLIATTTPPDSRQWLLREVVLGQSRELTQQREDGAESVLIDTQDRGEADLGPGEAYTRVDRARRRMTIRLKHPSSTELGEWQEIMARSRNGAIPLVMVPDSTADAALLCKVEPEWSSAHLRGSFTTSGCTLDELPHPSLTS